MIYQHFLKTGGRDVALVWANKGAESLRGVVKRAWKFPQGTGHASWGVSVHRKEENLRLRADPMLLGEVPEMSRNQGRLGSGV